jgi:membrane-bound acyltransferase YfiQ involved in biofilm formation
MDFVKKTLGNAPVFVISYIIFMIPTYYLPYIGSNSMIMHGMDAARGTSVMNIPFWFHMGAMLVLCFLCWVRGAHVGKSWLLVFPILAIVFDFVPGLSSIPIVPTAMHLLAIIMGVVGASTIATTT